MGRTWGLVFAVYAVGCGADDLNELLQAPSMTGKVKVAGEGDFYMAHYKIVSRELKSMVDLAKKANATKKEQAKKEQARKAKAGIREWTTDSDSSAGDIRDLPTMLRATNRGLDLLKACLHQVRKDQKIMLNTTTRVRRSVFQAFEGSHGFDVKAADVKKLDAAADALRKVINMYKYGFSRIISNEKPFGKKVEDFYSKGAGQSVRQYEEEMIRPVTPESLEAGLKALLDPLNEVTASLTGVSNITKRSDKAAVFREAGKKLRVLARAAHRGNDPLLARYGDGRLRREFDSARMQAQLVVGPQIMNKAWSVISETMENAGRRVEIMDGLAALIYEDKPVKQEAKGNPAAALAKGKKQAKGKKTTVKKHGDGQQEWSTKASK